MRDWIRAFAFVMGIMAVAAVLIVGPFIVSRVTIDIAGADKEIYGITGFFVAITASLTIILHHEIKKGNF